MRANLEETFGADQLVPEARGAVLRLVAQMELSTSWKKKLFAQWCRFVNIEPTDGELAVLAASARSTDGAAE